MTTLEELKSMPHGTEVVGFPVYIKTARKCLLDGDNNYWQEVVLMDSSCEMTAYILYSPPEEESEYNQRRKTALPGGIWRSGDRIVIIKATVQEADERRKESAKLMITECCSTKPNLTFDQSQEIDAQEWSLARKEEIRGKVRHWIVCSAIQSNQIQLMLPAHNLQLQAGIDQWVNYIVGE